MVKKSVNMKTRITMGPKASQKMKRRTVLFYTAVTVAFATIASVVVFTFLNLGNLENAFAAGSSYSSAISGPWTTNGTWSGGSAPATTNINGDNITINSNHNVTAASLDVDNNATFTVKSNSNLFINGNLVIKNNLILNITGTLTVTGNLTAQNGSNVTVNGGGLLKVNGNASFDNNAVVTVNGNLNVGGNLSFGSNPTFTGSGFVSTGSGCNYWSGSGSCSMGSLPVKLLSFEATPANGSVKLSWKTASEKNNNFFTLERTADGKTYQAIGTVPGAGTTVNVSSYAFEDTNALKGRSYYRLSQTDFDGKTETFPAVTIDVADTDEEAAAIQIYPNPLAGSVLTVSIADPKDGVLEVVDSRGNRVLSQIVSEGEKVVQLIMDDNITPGVYFVNHQAGGHKETMRLVKR
jgi:hypothetical protein